MLRSGSSYLSQSELVLTFGLGAQTKADSIEIQWPSGQVDKLSNVNAGQTVTVEEGKGHSGKSAVRKTVVRKITLSFRGANATRNLLSCAAPPEAISVCSVFPVLSVVKSLIR